MTYYQIQFIHIRISNMRDMAMDWGSDDLEAGTENDRTIWVVHTQVPSHGTFSYFTIAADFLSDWLFTRQRT